MGNAPVPSPRSEATRPTFSFGALSWFLFVIILLIGLLNLLITRTLVRGEGVRGLDDCAWAHSISRGISPELCRSLNRGMAVWRTQINYLRAALEGDLAALDSRPQAATEEGRLCLRDPEVALTGHLHVQAGVDRGDHLGLDHGLLGERILADQIDRVVVLHARVDPQRQAAVAVDGADVLAVAAGAAAWARGIHRAAAGIAIASTIAAAHTQRWGR